MVRSSPPPSASGSSAGGSAGGHPASRTDSGGPLDVRASRKRPCGNGEGACAACACPHRAHEHESQPSQPSQPAARGPSEVPPPLRHGDASAAAAGVGLRWPGTFTVRRGGAGVHGGAAPPPPPGGVRGEQLHKRQATEDERTPGAAGTGARARCVHGSQRARVARTVSCSPSSAGRADSRPSWNLCSPRARPYLKNSAHADERAPSAAGERARPGVAARASSREVLSAPREVARVALSPSRQPKAQQRARRARATPTFDRPWHGSLESYKSSAHGNRRMR